MKDAGVLFICELENVQQNGLMPVQMLTKVAKYWFEMRTIGLSRQYQAKGVNEQVDLLVRIPYDNSVRIGEYVVLGDESQYHIDNTTPIINDDGLRQTELTLSRLDKNFDVRTDYEWSTY